MDEFRLLGPLEAFVQGEPIRLAAPKPRALLALLLLNRNRVVPTERLIDELRRDAVEDRLQAELDAGAAAAVVSELEELVAAEPFRERPRALLMLALYRSDRQADALDLYRRTRELFVDELGIEPGPALQELERAVLQQDP